MVRLPNSTVPLVDETMLFANPVVPREVRPSALSRDKVTVTFSPVVILLPKLSLISKLIVGLGVAPVATSVGPCSG